MALINVSLPSDGSTADVADYNTPINTIVSEINGNLDNANIKASAAIATSKLATDAGIATGMLANASVTADKLSTGTQAATVATSQTTTSTSYTDLSTTGPAVTVTVGANGILLVVVGFFGGNSTGNAYSKMGFALSGANTLAADDTRAYRHQSYSGGARQGASRTFVLTGLTPGSTTVTAKYAVETGGSGAGTGTFVDRNIAAIPL